jgi:phospholipid/cholesterol/gamma-HCH transport system substrate-binding protein
MAKSIKDMERERVGHMAAGPERARPDSGAVREELLAALPARSRGREVWTGIFVLAGILAVLIALFTLTDAATFRGRYVVTTVVPDAGGIRRGDPVQMRGVNIGRVQRFQMVPEGVAIRLELEGEYAVPRDSRVALRSSGLLGGVVADMEPGASVERLRGGDIVPGLRAGGVFDLADDVGSRASDVLGQISAALSDQTVSALGDGAAELRVLLGELSLLATEQRQGLSELSRSLTRSAAGVERVATGPELERILGRLDAMAERTEAAAESLGRASGSLELVLARLERGEGTLGRLSVDAALYENVSQAAARLDSLRERGRLRPERCCRVRLF